MELKFFTDLIDALGKVAGWLKAIVNLPRAERETMRQTPDETYRLIDTTLSMVIIRLGDLPLLAADDRLPARGRPAGQVQRVDSGGSGVPAADEEQTHAVGLTVRG